MPKPDRKHLTPVRPPAGPPEAIEAEEAVLGALLALARIPPEVAEVLTEADFYRPAHRTVWQAITALGRNDQPADVMEVTGELRRRGVLEDLGGVVFLHHLMEATPTVAHAGHYARQVAEAARRRRVMDLGAKISATAADPTTDLAPLAPGWSAELDANTTPPGDSLTGRALVQRVADVEREHLRWLWEGRLPAGKLTILDGDPGNGKSTLTCDLAARVSTGTPMPYATGTPDGPAGVVLLTAEDGIADTVRPRLEAAGADLGKIVVLRHVTSPDGPRLPAIPTDLDVIKTLVCREQAALLVIDPLTAFLAPEVSTKDDKDVRRALHPVAELAGETGAAVLVVRHLNKTTGGSPLYRGGGSIGIIGAARLGLLVAPDPEDDGRRILAVAKINIAAAAPALAYRLVPDELYGCARIAWDGTTEHTAEQLLGAHAGLDAEETSARAEAEAFLREVLADGPIAAKDVQAQARELGISEASLRRAKARVGVRADRTTDDNRGHGRWYWSLTGKE